ncbi:MAG: HAD hydrolase-like protein, partial [Candidatus Thermoplasmatota archaeon]|nr:HAD hydrolase-like protein [Candidatus Thermoplasmatota archaeon]
MTQKAIILDMDGTIIDAVPSILRSINESLEAMGYAPLTAHEIRKNNDISLDSLFRIRTSEEELKRARQLYRDIQ